MIVLVDGATSYASCSKASYDIRDYGEDQGSYVNHKGKKYDFVDQRNGLYRYMYYNPAETEFLLGSIQTVSNDKIDGNGSFLDPIGTDYMDAVGALIRDYKKGTAESIKVYVIGFSKVDADKIRLFDIAMATTDDTKFYSAGSTEALAAIIDAVQKEINDSLWHIGGPN